MKITAQTSHGRLLLALRAGQMEAGEVAERFPGISSPATALARLGFIERTGLGGTGYFRITAAGRRACPTRRAAPSANHPHPNLPLEGEGAMEKGA